MKRTILLLYLILQLPVLADYHRQGIDTVYSFKPGSGQNSGQDSGFFPRNIIGLPDTNARDNFQAADPATILSIGLGGEIIVGFKNYILIDGPGADFTVFENAFINPVTQKVFAEPAKIAVSIDGINYIEFPYDMKTLNGCAGKTPTNGDKNPFAPEESGGDKFDLSEIGVDSVRWIKITDLCDTLLKDESNPWYDPIISGFDLDAVVGLHLVEDIIPTEVYNDMTLDNSAFFILPNPASDFIEISYSPSIKRGLGGVSDELPVRIHNVFGDEIKLTPPLSILGEGENNPLNPPLLRGNLKIDVSMLPPGVYFVRVGERVGRFLKI